MMNTQPIHFSAEDEIKELSLFSLVTFIFGYFAIDFALTDSLLHIGAIISLTLMCLIVHVTVGTPLKHLFHPQHNDPKKIVFGIQKRQLFTSNIYPDKHAVFLGLGYLLLFIGAANLTLAVLLTALLMILLQYFIYQQ